MSAAERVGRGNGNYGDGPLAADSLGAAETRHPVSRLVLSYDGRRYAGWQRQDNALAVQEAVENALSAVFEEPIRLHGAGRTDAGVHARGQVAHFRPPADRPRSLPPKALVHASNHRLPPDVRAVAADWMPDPFHAQRSAVGKEYAYRLYLGRVAPPWIARQAAVVGHDLDLEAMRRAARAIVGRHDFSAFALAGGSHSQPFRRVFGVSIEEQPSSDGDQVFLRFWGEGFLRGMVRSLVGTLLEVGKGRRQADDLERLLRPGQRREAAGPTAEAHGLCLEKVFYPASLRPLASYDARQGRARACGSLRGP